MDDVKCQHELFACDCTVNRIEDTGRFNMDVRVKCDQCGIPFRFIGLPAGLDMNGAATSVDATEARLAIAPKGEVLSELEGGDVGFSVRKSTLACPKCGKPDALTGVYCRRCGLDLP